MRWDGAHTEKIPAEGRGDDEWLAEARVLIELRRASVANVMSSRTKTGGANQDCRSIRRIPKCRSRWA